MDRTDLYMQMLDATAKLQDEITHMLEARVIDATKYQNWICQHVNAMNVEGHELQMKVTGEIHDSVIDLIDGLTKLENALNHQMKALLGGKESGTGFGMGNGLDFGGGSFPLSEDEKL
ncbi:hypothetical protein A8709_00235 [Paenibacillus pectinilyticus]|uniref:Restriction endonuclease subunit S n=1 Tax=Paenibacillus pectinilyticus TaxID=512399 RepID=A0A1C1A0P3_9BACL|nr:hypothetical protein [Paenibacillus pectinilyticus]OCT14004.1 hypothetical protein A8709_00235 [Paenibacillus pectinilyticus]